MTSVFPLATSSWDEEELAAIHSVIASDRYTMGPEVHKYERQFADHFGAEHAVMTSSGSTANLLMVAACFYTQVPHLQRGDEVIVPAVSWSTTYFPLQQYGLHVKFVDVDRHTLNVDLNQLEAAVTDRTRAIMVVNLLGNPNDFERIQRIIGDRNIIVLEDNCESMGATFNDKHAGTFGLMGSFSSFFSHHISTMEGGCIVTDSEELYHVLLSLRAHGWTRDLPQSNLVTGEKEDDPFAESFKFVLPGYNVRPLEMSGAIGQVQLSKLEGFVETRQTNARLFQELFENDPYLEIQRTIGASSWFGFSLVIRENAPFTRSELIAALGQGGIECRPIVSGNFLKNERVLSYFDYEVHGHVPNADYIDRHGLFVGNHQIPLEDGLRSLRSRVDQLVDQQGITRNA